MTLTNILVTKGPNVIPKKFFPYEYIKKMHLFQKTTTYLKWPVCVLYLLTQTDFEKSR